MKLNRKPEQWARVRPDAFLDGSIVQARNIIEMMQQDIAQLAAELALLQSECPTCSWKTPGSHQCSTENCIRTEHDGNGNPK